MEAILNAIKQSAIKISQVIVDTDLGKSDSKNSTGDEQLKLDVLSDVIIEEAFASVESIKRIISEEKEDEVFLHENGTYLVGYDPLDGSSLVDVNLSVGSIFGIYQESYDGFNMVASVYVVYGPRIEMVVALDDVKLYRLSGDDFIYIKTLQLDNKGVWNATGGTQKNWLPHHKAMIDGMFANGYQLRYSGGMVPDLHQILLKKGGLFSYPATSDAPNGKLRKVFEVFPFAFVYEKAGGEAINGEGLRLLDLPTHKLHESSPCFFGSKYEIGLVKDGNNRG